jgi:hypothetical protein
MYSSKRTKPCEAVNEDEKLPLELGWILMVNKGKTVTRRYGAEGGVKPGHLWPYSRSPRNFATT